MSQQESLSPWWRQTVILVLIFGFTILIGMAVAAYKDAPPIPAKAVGPNGEIVFTREDVKSGQQVFLKYGLMENGTIWGHGAYLGPDFSADYLHTLAIHAAENAARTLYGKELASLNPVERGAVDAEVRQTLKQNRYDAGDGHADAHGRRSGIIPAPTGQMGRVFLQARHQRGPAGEIYHRPRANSASSPRFSPGPPGRRPPQRPGKKFSYTNNFPYDPAAGNSRAATRFSGAR